MVEQVWPYTTPGIPDELFIRGKVPMTKEEVRVLTLSKLCLQRNSLVLDIGAGTGSISVECALRSSQGRVYAVEKNPEAVELIRANSRKFAVNNLQVVEGQAPACLEGLPAMDRVVIGGSSGQMEALVEKAGQLLKPGGRLVINAVLLETLWTGRQAMKKGGFDQVDLLSVAVSRGKELGGKTALEGMSPVFILWGNKA